MNIEEETKVGNDENEIDPQPAGQLRRRAKSMRAASGRSFYCHDQEIDHMIDEYAKTDEDSSKTWTRMFVERFLMNVRIQNAALDENVSIDVLLITCSHIRNHGTFQVKTNQTDQSYQKHMPTMSTLPSQDIYHRMFLQTISSYGQRRGSLPSRQNCTVHSLQVNLLLANLELVLDFTLRCCGCLLSP